MAAAKGINWDEVRDDYEHKGLNPAALAIKYNVAATTVYQKARSEKWRKPVEEDVDPEFDEGDEEELIKSDVALHEQKRYLMRLHREIDASTSKPGQMKQWIKEATAGSIDSKRKIAYQMMSLGNRVITLKNAAHVLKMIVEVEIATGTLVVATGKKALLDKAAREMAGEDDSVFAARRAPSPRANGNGYQPISNITQPQPPSGGSSASKLHQHEPIKDVSILDQVG